MPPRRFQEPEGAHDVGVQKVLRAVDGTVHVTLGGKMHDCGERVLGEEGSEQDRVGDVAVDKRVPATAALVEISQGGAVAGVGEFVEVDHPGFRSGRQGVPHKVRADKAGSAGD